MLFLSRSPVYPRSTCLIQEVGAFWSSLVSTSSRSFSCSKAPSYTFAEVPWNEKEDRFKINPAPPDTKRYRTLGVTSHDCSLWCKNFCLSQCPLKTKKLAKGWMRRRKRLGKKLWKTLRVDLPRVGSKVWPHHNSWLCLLEVETLPAGRDLPPRPELRVDWAIDHWTALAL